MSEDTRKYAVVVFGATGFTGQYVLQELLSCKPSELRVAAAGRSAAGLHSVLQQLKSNAQADVLADVDVNNYDSVLHMARSAKLVINCVGPYRLYGEAVVRACVEAGTHYLDVCGEPEFMERMAFKYGQQAATAGCYMASSCGFDSIPADWGTVLAQEQFKPPAVPSSVEMYVRIKPGQAGYKVHFATWESAVLGFASLASLQALRSQVRGNAPATGKQPAPVGPRLKPAAGLTWCKHPAVASWHLPFPGADASVVRRTQAALAAAGQPAVHFAARVMFPTLYYAFVAMAVAGLMSILAKYSWGRRLLLRYPSLFSYGLISHEGPTAEQMAGTQTITTLIARGYAAGAPAARDARPDKQVVVQITAPDPGYSATSVFVTQAALTVLSEPSSLPPPGIHTPGFLLRRTTYRSRITGRGLRVEVSS